MSDYLRVLYDSQGLRVIATPEKPIKVQVVTPAPTKVSKK